MGRRNRRWLRFYGFTDLRPSLPLPPADPRTRIRESKRRRFRASVGGIRIGPEDPQRQSARTRADQLDLPPPNDGVEEKRQRRWTYALS